MAKFRTKSIVKEAIQFDGPSSLAEMKRAWDPEFTDAVRTASHNHMSLETIEGVFGVPLNHWVIKGVKGEFYACAPDVFENTYYPVEE